MNPLEPEEKEELAVRALTLRDRFDLPLEETRSDPSGEWLNEWQKQVADGEFDAFLSRLDIADVSISECRQRLDRRKWPDSEPLPKWVHRVDDILNYADTNPPNDLTFESDDETEIPFFHVLTVITDFTLEQLDETVTDQLSPSAVDAVEQWLLDRLDSLFAHSLFIEFKTFLADRDRDLALADAPEMPDSPHRHYTAFVNHLFDGGLRSFFLEYAVSSKLLVTIIDQLETTVEEFCSRLEGDRAALRESFADGEPLGTVVDVEFLGDRHRDGRRVVGVTFESGTKVAYKPRSIEPEATFYKFLSWVNENGELPTLKTLDCLCREEYGWMEWIESHPCDDADGIRTYYQRAGVLLCLLYALNFTDGHLENIIATGDQPVLIDLETLAQPTLSPEKRPGESATYEIIRDSILRTGFIPMNLPESNLEDVGGLGEERGKHTNAQIPEFRQPNTDVMELAYQETATIEGESLPHVDGDRIRPNEYRDDIASGFEAAYRFVLDCREDILAEDGPLQSFCGVECRYLYRATKVYHSRLIHLSTPSNLRSGVAFGCKAESLARPFTTGAADNEMWDVYEAERTAMWRLDVPRFTVRTDDTHLSLDGSVVAENVFESSPMKQIRRRIEELDESDLREQLDYVTIAYQPKELYRPDAESWSVPDTDVESVVGRTPQETLDRIHRNSYRTRSGELTWRVREKFQGNGFHLRRIAENLYNGRLGIALLAAGLSTVSDDQMYREFAGAVVAPLTEELDGSDPYSRMEIGGGTGVGSLVYGFTKLGELLDSEEYLRRAHQLASLLNRERIEADEWLDVLRGSAGAILGLLALYEATGDEVVLETATAAGDHLLSSRVECDGYRAWRTTTHDKILTGFSHGVSGIAYALVRLSDASGDSRFREAAIESLRFEEDWFDPGRGNWPELHPEADDEFTHGWSAGRAGGGLARLGMYEITRRDDLEREIRCALRNDEMETLSGSDDMCFGNLGRVAFFLRAGRTFEESDYIERACRLADGVVRRAESNGQFAVPWQTPDWHNPSFFLGESGIGYSLLRLSNPNLPCVLLWE